jgi:hypothetical protein
MNQAMFSVDTLVHDSTKTFKPIIYQFLVALKKWLDDAIFEPPVGETPLWENAKNPIEVNEFSTMIFDIENIPGNS